MPPGDQRPPSERHGPTAGAVLLWHFDEMGGNTVFDASDFGNDGFIDGQGVWDDRDAFEGGGPGAGFSFDFGATGGYAETGFPALDGGPEITMEMFIWAHGAGTQNELFRREGWGILRYDNAQQKFIFGLDGIGVLEWSSGPTSGGWQHIAAEYDGANMRIYWEGDPVANIPVSGNLPSSPNPLRIGQGFDGLADVIRISDVARYKGDFFDPYGENYAPDAITWLLYNCNEGGGNVLIDESQGGHDAMITGNPTWDPNEPLGPGGPVGEGLIDGNIFLDQDHGFAQLRISLFFPGNTSGQPDLVDDRGEQSPFPPAGRYYEFRDPAIGPNFGPYTVDAFFDKNDNGIPDMDEPRQGGKHLHRQQCSGSPRSDAGRWRWWRWAA